MQKKDGVILAILVWLLWPKPAPAIDVTLSQSCYFPDGSVELVPLGDACPYDDARGGQSALVEETTPPYNPGAMGPDQDDYQLY